MNEINTRPRHSAGVSMLLGQLITNEILDTRILSALKAVPRERFVPENLREVAYVDEDIAVGGGRFLLAPLTFARILSLAEISANCRVLIIGALNGYSAIVAAHLAAHVVATETDEISVKNIRSHAAALGIGHVDAEKVENLQHGYALSQPYDVILICGGAQTIPDALLSQLALDGRLVTVSLPVRESGYAGGMGKIVVYSKQGAHFYPKEFFDAAGKLLPGFESALRVSSF